MSVPVKHTIAILTVAGSLAALVACSSSSSGGSGGNGVDSGAVQDSGSGSADVGADVIINPNNCVKPGTPNNAQGVGGYCSPGGGQCNTAGPGGSPTLCSGDYNSMMNVWFCTLPCPQQACGTGAVCVTTAMGSGCTPLTCLSYLGDAGTLYDGGNADDAAGD
jgi:hypothetical protein